jgi:hypothetical protein
MSTHRVHAGIKIMVGFAAMFASVQANEDNGLDPAGSEGPTVEIALVDVESDAFIECTAFDAGYLWIENGINAGVTVFEDYSNTPMPMEPPGFIVYQFREGQLPVKAAEHLFDEDELAMYGHASGRLGPFSNTLPDDQIVTFNTENGDVQVVILENTTGVDMECSVFTFIPDFTGSAIGYSVDASSVVPKKKAVKRKVAKKKAVKKKAATKKAAVKRKKAATKRKAP